jgi:hypothetical protein
MNHPAVRDREVRASQDAMQIVKVQSALILADTIANTYEINDIPVEIRSAAEWLLNDKPEKYNCRTKLRIIRYLFPAAGRESIPCDRLPLAAHAAGHGHPQ